MKPSFSDKISTIVLWVCMLVTLGIFAAYYLAYSSHQDNMDTGETTAILNWLYIILTINLISVLFFSVYYSINQWKNNRRKIWQQIAWLLLLGILFFTAYALGSGEPLPIPGYQGKENSYTWLKLTDMWIYSIYILLVLTFISLLGGILWSYIKKRK